MSESKVIELRISTTFLRKDGILQVDVSPNAEMNLSDAVESINAQAVLAAGIKRPLLVRMGSMKSMSRDARSYLGGPEAAKNVYATALVIGSPIGRVIGNFFLGLNKTIYPTRLFTSEEDAISWLKELLK
ncbi:STAS/SEC14 domain-containing protein [Bdellovibrionota bacterium FG-2]